MLHFPTSERSIIFIFTEFRCGLGEESLLLLSDQQGVRGDAGWTQALRPTLLSGECKGCLF